MGPPALAPEQTRMAAERRRSKVAPAMSLGWEGHIRQGLEEAPDIEVLDAVRSIHIMQCGALTDREQQKAPRKGAGAEWLPLEQIIKVLERDPRQTLQVAFGDGLK